MSYAGAISIRYYQDKAQAAQFMRVMAAHNVKDEHCDVLVIGAGVAGLAAALLLAHSGRTVRLIEARDRVGGRIFTQHTQRLDAHGSLPVELGAEFIHGLPPASWSLIADAGLATYELDGERYCFEHGELQSCGPEQHDSFALLGNMADWLQQHSQQPDPTFDEYLRAVDVDASMANRAAAYVEGLNAADRAVISATALVRQQRAEHRLQGDRIFHLRAGYSALPRYLADRLLGAGGTILLDSRVRRVNWRRGDVIVTGTRMAREFSLRAAQVIITLPLGVLQANSVIFDPLPGEVQTQWQSLAMGQVNRVSLLFNNDFWSTRANNLSFLSAPNEYFPTWWTAAPESIPIMTGWAGGASHFLRTQRLSGSDPTALKTAALKSLANIFSMRESQLAGCLRGFYHHDWHGDEFSRGAYSYVAAGAVHAARHMSTPLADTLYFAGEHTDTEDQWGTVHGALASGTRAARQVLNMI
jgi:monoamine oxidase